MLDDELQLKSLLNLDGCNIKSYKKELDLAFYNDYNGPEFLSIECLDSSKKIWIFFYFLLKKWKNAFCLSIVIAGYAAFIPKANVLIVDKTIDGVVYTRSYSAYVVKNRYDDSNNKWGNLFDFGDVQLYQENTMAFHKLNNKKYNVSLLLFKIKYLKITENWKFK